MTAEQWLPIPGYDGDYDVSNDGQVRSWKRKRLVLRKLRIEHYGYFRVDLWRGGQEIPEFPHRLVLLAFVGPCPEGQEVRHLDGNQRNNALSNLAYGTHGENEYDKVRHGTHPNAAKTHCPQGHLYDAANTYHWPDAPSASRACRICIRAANARRRQRKVTI